LGPHRLGELGATDRDGGRRHSAEGRRDRTALPDRHNRFDG
jgi:hypothetical protein